MIKRIAIGLLAAVIALVPMMQSAKPVLAAPVRGDVDGDGAITSTDARLVLQYSVGKVGESDLSTDLADVDGDNTITTTDARLILQYSVGKIDTFPFDETPMIGATVPFITYEAESATLENGAVVGQEYYRRQAASGKQYAELGKVDSSVSFVATKAANRVTIRYSAPYRSTAVLEVLVNGQSVTLLTLNTVQCHGIREDGNRDSGVRRYTESAVETLIKAGDTVTLINRRGDIAVDLVDMETAPDPVAKPENALSIVDFGATPDDDTDDSDAIDACFQEAARGRKWVYVPAGTFLQSRRITIPAYVKFTGAGIWYSNIEFTTPGTTYSNTSGYSMSHSNVVSGIHFNDRVAHSRGDATILFRPFGNYQMVEDCWFSNVGCVFGWDNVSGKNVFRNNRVIGTYFDATHWGDGRSAYNEMYENYFRGIGDDAIAQVNREDMGLCEGNYAHHNTIVASYWGRGISVVGGNDLILRYNKVYGTYNAGLIITTENLSPSKSRPIQNILVEYNEFSLCGHTVYDDASVTASNHATIHMALMTNPMYDVIIRHNILRNGDTKPIQLDRTEYDNSEAVFENNVTEGFGKK